MFVINGHDSLEEVVVEFEWGTREDLSMADGFGFDFRRRKLYRN